MQVLLQVERFRSRSWHRKCPASKFSLNRTDQSRSFAVLTQNAFNQIRRRRFAVRPRYTDHFHPGARRPVQYIPQNRHGQSSIFHLKLRQIHLLKPALHY
ncbi:hypothetical protein D3C77_551130 [compost metagenome]